MQLDAAGFVPVKALIVKSESVRESTGFLSWRRRTVYELEYIYHVNGVVYLGKQVDLTGSQGGLFRSQVFAMRFLAGHEVTAYYDSKNPSRSVLENRFLLDHGALLAFALLSGAGLLVMLVDGAATLRGAYRRWPHGGVPVRREGCEIRVQMPPTSPRRLGLIAATGWLGFVALLVMGIVVFGISGVPYWVLLAALAPTPVLGVGAALYRLNHIRRGEFDLVIDTLARTVRRNGPDFEFRPIAISEIVGVRTGDVVDSEQRRTATYVQIKTERRAHRVVEWPEEQRADNFAAWLCAELNRVGG